MTLVTMWYQSLLSSEALMSSIAEWSIEERICLKERIWWKRDFDSVRYLVKVCAFSFFKLPCDLQRRWRPCDARVSCPLRPWWALLHSLYLANKCTSYVDISVFGVTSLLPSAVPVTATCSRPCRLMTCPRKFSCSCRIIFINSHCTVCSECCRTSSHRHPAMWTHHSSTAAAALATCAAT